MTLHLTSMFCRKTSRYMNAKKEKLLKYVQTNNTRGIEKLVFETPDLLTEKFDHLHDNRTILQIACDDKNSMDKVEESTIATLIKLRADVNAASEKDNWQALHYAAINSNKAKISALVKHLDKNQLQSVVFCNNRHLRRKFTWCSEKKNPSSYSNNALNIILKYGNPNADFHDCVGILIQAGVSLDNKDSNGVSSTDLIRAIDNKTLNEIMDSYHGNLKAAPLGHEKVFDALKVDNGEEFLKLSLDEKSSNCFDGADEQSSSCTLLQLACFKGLESCVRKILESHGDPNKTIPKNPNAPIMIAIKNNKETIIKLLLTSPNIVLPEDILIDLQRRYKRIKNFSRIDKYMEIVLDFLEKKNSSVTKKYLIATDELNRTALHYATYYRCSESVLKLLTLGAPLTKVDIFGFTPLNHIEPSLLETFLDSCIKVPKSEDEINNMLHSLRNEKTNFNIEIDYQSLINKDHDKDILESKFLERIIKMKHFDYLLNHPVIMSYLTIKWKKFRPLVVMNLMLYFVAYVSLLFYGFNYKTYTDVSNILLLVSLGMLTFREISQMAIFQYDYLKRIDSYVNLFLIGGIIYIIATGWFQLLLDKNQTQNLLVAFSVVFLTSTIGIFIQLGNIQFFTIKVIIFRKISINFFRYMLFYIFPVLAFFFCFYFLIEDENKDVNKFFQILYQTTVMFAGDASSDFPDTLQTNPIFAHMIYVAFVVLIGIILQNLLIGLAVSDLQEIQKEAEFIDKKERIEYITNLEKIFYAQYESSTSRIFRKLFKMFFVSYNVFDDDAERVLVIQPYNYGCVFVKNRSEYKMYINDETILAPLQNVFKDLTLKGDEEEHMSIKNLYDKMEIIENLLKEKLNLTIDSLS